jgi:hypothetical protein
MRLLWPSSYLASDIAGTKVEQLKLELDSLLSLTHKVPARSRPVITSFLRKLTVEVTLDFLPVGRVSRLRQYDRINDFVAFKLCGDKRPVFRQFLVSEFHSSAVGKFLDPLVVLHGNSKAEELIVARKDVA